MPPRTSPYRTVADHAAQAGLPPATTAGRLAHAELAELRATIAAIRLALHCSVDLVALEDLVEALVDQAPPTPRHDTAGVQLLLDTIRQHPQLADTMTELGGAGRRLAGTWEAGDAG
jgi:hypothetical protein